MSKHTPGPWTMDEVRTDSGRAFRIGSGEMLRAGKGCCIIYDDHGGGDNERKANARLIVTAPDLLTLLQELIDIEGPQPGSSAWAVKVQAAIAKATGDA